MLPLPWESLISHTSGLNDFVLHFGGIWRFYLFYLLGLFPLTLIINFFVPVRRWVADDVGKKSCISYQLCNCPVLHNFCICTLFFTVTWYFGREKKTNQTAPNFHQDPSYKVRWKWGWKECRVGGVRQRRPCFPAVSDPSPLLGSIDPCFVPFIVSVEYQLFYFLPSVRWGKAAAACSRIFHWILILFSADTVVFIFGRHCRENSPKETISLPLGSRVDHC